MLAQQAWKPELKSWVEEWRHPLEPAHQGLYWTWEEMQMKLTDSAVAQLVSQSKAKPGKASSITPHECHYQAPTPMSARLVEVVMRPDYGWILTLELDDDPLQSYVYSLMVDEKQTKKKVKEPNKPAYQRLSEKNMPWLIPLSELIIARVGVEF